MKFLVANLEAGYPTANEALLRLDFELARARRSSALVVKIIHGYGSTGAGGVLRDVVQAALRRMVAEQRVRSFVPGEDWRTSNEVSWEIQKLVPELRNDKDLGRSNKGISVVLL